MTRQPEPEPTLRPTASADGGLVASLRGLPRDARILFITRCVRMFGYGGLTVVLALYLAGIGLDPFEIGLVLALVQFGDAGMSLVLTTRADRLGRRRVLLLGAVLMVVAGLAFGLSDALPVLIAAGIVGVISPTGNDAGPFLAIEQSGLSQTVPSVRRTATFAWYYLAGNLARAVGSLTAGLVSQVLVSGGVRPVESDRVIVLGYAGLGLILMGLFAALDRSIEVEPTSWGGSTSPARRRLGLGRSRATVIRLSALFSMDAFAGGLIPQALIALWLSIRFGVEPGVLGVIFFVANLLAAVSALWAARIAARVGLINTMVFTHLPSNVLVILVPLMPSLPLAVALLLSRFALSQMDVPTRQSYVMAVVDPDERSAAAGVTDLARSAGAAISPGMAAPLLSDPLLAPIAFGLGGGLKIIYDLLLWRSFRAHPPPEER